MSAIRPGLLLLVVIPLAIPGCGLKGPLYLPEPATSVEVRPAAPAGERPDEREDERKEDPERKDD